MVCGSKSLLVLAVAVFVAALVVPPPATQASPAASIPVTITGDEWDSGTGCSLREAIQAANSDAAFGGCPAGSGADVIDLPAGTYTLTRAGIQDDANITGDLDLNSDITINGAGQASTIIDGDERDRVLHIHGFEVVLNDLTVTGGWAPDGTVGADAPNWMVPPGDGGDGASGGGILSTGELVLNRCTISSNRAGSGGRGGDGYDRAPQDAPGGAGESGRDASPGGDGGHGGGIHSSGTLVLNACTLEDNRAGDGGQGGAGGDGGDGGPGGSSAKTGGTGGEGGRGGYGGPGGSGGAVSGQAPTEMADTTVRSNQSGDSGTGGPGGAGGEGGAGYNGASSGEGGAGGDGGDGAGASAGGTGGGIYCTEFLTVTGSLVALNQAGAGGQSGTGGPGGDGGIGGNGSGFGSDGGRGGSGGRGGGSSFAGEGGNGGGINARAGLSLILSEVRTNQAGPGGPGGAGGASGNGGRGGHATVGGSAGAGGTGGMGSWGGSAAGGGSGGGIWARALTDDELVLKESTISGNSSGGGGSGGMGGAGGDAGEAGDGSIPVDPPGENGEGGHGGSGAGGGAGGGFGLVPGNLGAVVEACTVVGNSTGDGGRGGDGGASGMTEGAPGGRGGDGGEGYPAGSGGGLFLLSKRSSLVNTTISYNHTGQGGRGGDGGAGADVDGDGGDGRDGGYGAGFADMFNTKTSVANCTFVLNGADGLGGQGGTGDTPGTAGTGGRGGGLYARGAVTMTHTILAGNSAAYLGPDCYGGPYSDDHNLIESIQDCGVTNPGNDIIGAGPGLMPLADNGGPTETYAPLETSPAVEGGNITCFRPDGSGLGVDQRGFGRPAIAGGGGAGFCDIGAVEVQLRQILVVATVGQGTVDSEPAGIDCGADCEETYWDSTVVTLTATADTGSRFVSWSGDCEGTNPVCASSIYKSATVTATFGLDQVRVYLPMVLRE